MNTVEMKDACKKIKAINARLEKCKTAKTKAKLIGMRWQLIMTSF
jgi:primosomal protein N''